MTAALFFWSNISGSFRSASGWYCDKHLLSMLHCSCGKQTALLYIYMYISCWKNGSAKEEHLLCYCTDVCQLASLPYSLFAFLDADLHMIVPTQFLNGYFMLLPYRGCFERLFPYDSLAVSMESFDLSAASQLLIFDLFLTRSRSSRRTAFVSPSTIVLLINHEIMAMTLDKFINHQSH